MKKNVKFTAQQIIDVINKKYNFQPKPQLPKKRV